MTITARQLEVEATLQRTGGNVNDAAALLGCTPENVRMIHATHQRNAGRREAGTTTKDEIRAHLADAHDRIRALEAQIGLVQPAIDEYERATERLDAIAARFEVLMGRVEQLGLRPSIDHRRLQDGGERVSRQRRRHRVGAAA